MPKKGKEIVTVRRQSTKDRYGNRVLGEVVGQLKRCIVYPRASSEDSDRGIVAIDGQNVWAPSPLKIDVYATDDVEIRGELHSIEGKPGDWRKSGKRLGLLFQTERYGA